MDIKMLNRENKRFFFEIDKGRLNYVTLNYHSINEDFEIILSTQKDGLNKKLYDNTFHMDVVGEGELEIDLGFSLFSKHRCIKTFNLIV